MLAVSIQVHFRRKCPIFHGQQWRVKGVSVDDWQTLGHNTGVLPSSKRGYNCYKHSVKDLNANWFQYGQTNYGKGIAVLSGILHVFGGTEAFSINLELYDKIKIPSQIENRWDTVATLAIPRYGPKVSLNQDGMLVIRKNRDSLSPRCWNLMKQLCWCVLVRHGQPIFGLERR